jgi:phage gp36-like protein
VEAEVAEVAALVAEVDAEVAEVDAEVAEEALADAEEEAEVALAATPVTKLEIVAAILAGQST